MTTTPKHRLRWYQFTIRSLLVLTVLVAIGGSSFTVKRQQAERERAAVMAINGMGGTVIYDYQFNAIVSGSSKAAARPPGPSWLRAWLGDEFLAHAVIVNFNGTRVTDDQLGYVKDLPRLKTLQISRTQVTDVGLEHVTGLDNLRMLWLTNSNVTDEGVKRLQQALPKCEIYD